MFLSLILFLSFSDSKLFETTAVLKSKNDKLKEENLSLQIKVDNAGSVLKCFSQDITLKQQRK